MHFIKLILLYKFENFKHGLTVLDFREAVYKGLVECNEKHELILFG